MEQDIEDLRSRYLNEDFDEVTFDIDGKDFAEYARNCGGHGVRVNDVRELDNALATAIAHDGPAIVEVMSDVELI